MVKIVEAELVNIMKMEEEGIVFLGCGGDINKWANDALKCLLEEHAIYSLDAFPLGYRFIVSEPSLNDEEDIICLFFPFPANTEDISLGRLAVVRLMMSSFCKWRSDFVDIIRDTCTLG